MSAPTLIERPEAANGPFVVGFIPDYATRRAYSFSKRTGRHEHAYYDVPDNGIHLCGQDMNQAAATAARYPMSAATARQLFDLAKTVAECGEEEADFVVDLCIAGQIDHDFWTNRQLWPLAIEAWNTALRAQTPGWK